MCPSCRKRMRPAGAPTIAVVTEPVFASPAPPPPPPPAWGPGGNVWAPLPGAEFEPPKWSEPVSKNGRRLAIWSLVVGLIPVFGGIPAIVLGVLALKRLEPGRRVRMVAVIGIVFGSLWTVGLAARALTHQDEIAVGDVSNTTTSAAAVSVFDLKVGDCTMDTADTDKTVRTVELVACTEPHRGEVFARYAVPGSKYPGEAEVKRLVYGHCLATVESYIGSAAAEKDQQLVYFMPTERSWSGNRAAVCILAAPAGQTVTGSSKA